MSSKKAPKTYYSICNLCFLATKKSIPSDHKCPVVEQLRKNGLPPQEAAKLLQAAKEAAQLHERYRNKRLIVKSRSLLRHMKQQRQGGKVRSCCRHAAIEAARYCGSLVAKSERPRDRTEDVQWFQPKKSSTDPIVRSVHNLAFVGNPPAGTGRVFLGSVLESNELVDSDVDSSDDEDSSLSSGTDDDEAQQQRPPVSLFHVILRLKEFFCSLSKYANLLMAGCRCPSVVCVCVHLLRSRLAVGLEVSAYFIA